MRYLYYGTVRIEIIFTYIPTYLEDLERSNDYISGYNLGTSRGPIAFWTLFRRADYPIPTQVQIEVDLQENCKVERIQGGRVCKVLKEA